MDALSKLAAAWSQTKQENDQAEGGMSPEMMRKLMGGRAPAGELKTNMAFGGSTVTVPYPDDTEKPPQEMEASVIEAEAPKGREHKTKPINRVLLAGQDFADRLKPDQEVMSGLSARMKGIGSGGGSGRPKLDLSEFQGKQSDSRRDVQEWSGDDYLKAALIATLPALAGGIAGGLGGAAGGSIGGIKGIDFALKDQADRRKMKDEKGIFSAANAINAYKAEVEADSKYAKTENETIESLAKAFKDMSEPQKAALVKLIDTHGSLEGGIYQEEIKDEGDTLRKVEELGSKEGVETENRASRDKNFQKDLDMDEDLADRSNNSRERIANNQIAALTGNKAAEIKSREQMILQEIASKQKIAAQKAKAGGGGKKGGGLNPDKILKVQEGLTIPNSLQDIRETIQQNQGKFGFFAGKVGRINPYDKTAQAMESQISITSQAFGKYMEGGKLMKEDEIKYRKMFPNLDDYPDTAIDKLDNVERTLTNKINGDIDALKAGGFNSEIFAKPKVPTVPKSMRQNEGQKVRDPKIEKLAKDSNVSYEIAERAVEARKAKKAVPIGKP